MISDPILALVRPEILALTPYSSARKESSGGTVWLDANENPVTPRAGLPRLNRYPEPQPADLVARLSSLYGVTTNRVLVTRGSDEGIDLLLRAFCRAGKDAILITPPTYGMYTVAAGIQGARVVSVPLVRERDFALAADAVIAAATSDVKLVFLCSPNNPTGQLLERDAVLKIVRALATRAVVVVDEAYIEFADDLSLVADLRENRNLVVLRTLSKAFGLAGARVGTLLASETIIGVLQNIIAPYPIPTPVVHAARDALTTPAIEAARQSALLQARERRRIAAELPKFSCVRKIWPSDANFLLVQVADVAAVLTATRAAGIIIRDRRKDVADTVRLTVGTIAENNLLLETLARV